MQIIDLFSGIGGFSVAGHELGWETVAFCEINPFGRQVLKHHFPTVPIFGDVKKLNRETIEKETNWERNKSTIITCGFPCQPFSHAGKREGTDDDRHLWPEAYRLIREVEPDYVLAENVLGILSIAGGMVFEQVCIDLEDAGYEVQAVVAPACGVDAPHRRDRVWFVGKRIAPNTESDRNSGKLRRLHRTDEGDWKPEEHGQDDRKCGNDGRKRDASHTPGYIGRGEPQQPFGDGRTQGNQPFGSRPANGFCHPATFQIRAVDTDTHQDGRRPFVVESGGIGKELAIGSDTAGTHADTAGKQGEPSGIEQPNIGRPQSGQLGRSDSPGSGFKLYDFRRFPSESPVRRNDDGISDRLDIGAVFEGIGKLTSNKWASQSIAALGNAIVPQIALQIFKSIIDTENKLK